MPLNFPISGASPRLRKLAAKQGKFYGLGAAHGWRPYGRGVLVVYAGGELHFASVRG